MKKKMKIGVLITCILLCLCVFPLCLIRRETNIDPILQADFGVTENEGNQFVQTFIAQTGYLSELAFDISFLNGKPQSGELLLRLSEDGGKVIAERKIPFSDIGDGEFTTVSIGKWIKKGALYSLELWAEKGGFQGIYTRQEHEHAPGSAALYFDGELIDGQAVVRYVYGFPLNIKNILCLWAFLWMLTLILLEGIGGGESFAQNRILLKAEKLLIKWQIPVLCLEFAVIMAMIIRICRNEAVDWDESYTWQMVTKNTVPEMLKATAADVHPPLYYLLVMGAMAVFGQNIFAAKMVSVAGAAATGILGITLVRKRWGVKTAIPFLLVSGLGTQMIYYNVNLRMYSWVIFFVLAAGLFACEITESGKIIWWAAFTLVSLGGVYTQYFSVVPLALIYLFLFIWIMVNDRKQIRKWLLCCAATVAGYLPWLAAVIGTLRRDTGGERTDTVQMKISDLCKWAFESNIEFSAYMPALLFIAATAGLIFGYQKCTKREGAFRLLFGTIFFLSYGLCMIVVSQTQHFWSYRYLTDTLLFIWLFMLIFLAGKNMLAWGMGMIWIGILSLSSYTVASVMELQTIPWTREARELLAPIQDEEKIVYTFPTFDVLYEYYLPNAEFIWYEDADFSELGEEFYMIMWGGNDFPYWMYAEGILEREKIGNIRLEEGAVSELWKVIYQNPEE